MTSKTRAVLYRQLTILKGAKERCELVANDIRDVDDIWDFSRAISWELWQLEKRINKALDSNGKLEHAMEYEDGK